MADEAVTLLDRGTIRTWRVVNVVGWTSLGFVAALFFRYAGEAAAMLLFRSQGVHAFDYLPIRMGAVVAVPSSVVAGAAAGTLIGGRAYRWPIALSALATTLAAVAWWLLWSSPPSGTRALVGLGTALVMVPIAVLSARRAERSRIPNRSNGLDGV
jgi:hypothetical protein